MRTSWGLIVFCSSQNLREAVETKSPLCHLSAEFYYCFDPDGCPDKRRNPFKSYNGCNLISGQQNCCEQRTLLLLFFSFFLLWVTSFTSLAVPCTNSHRWQQFSEHTAVCWWVPQLLCSKQLLPYSPVQTIFRNVFVQLNGHCSLKRKWTPWRVHLKSRISKQNFAFSLGW